MRGAFGKLGPPREAKKSQVALIVGHVTGIIVFGTSIFLCVLVKVEIPYTMPLSHVVGKDKAA